MVIRKLMRYALIAAAVCVVVALGALWSLSHPYLASGGETFIRIERGSSSAAIAHTLEVNGIIRYRWQLYAARLLHGSSKLQAGEYRFAEPASALTVFDRIRRGDIYHFEITIPEGSNRWDIARILGNESDQRRGSISGDDFLKASGDPASIRDLAPHAPSLEGFLFPATYRLTRETTAKEFCHMMTTEFRRQWKKLDPNHTADALKTVTLASLVEKETGFAAERKTVSSVLTNRIEKGMRLECDPTTIYASLLAGTYNGTIHKSELESNSPYNTYRHAGLPPGPIANPGAATMDAALHPAATNYLFFVAKAEGGGHVFTSTLAEHEKAVLAYRHAKHKAG